MPRPSVRSLGGLGLPDDVAERLSNLTPGTYVGLAEKLVEEYLE